MPDQSEKIKVSLPNANNSKNKIAILILALAMLIAVFAFSGGDDDKSKEIVDAKTRDTMSLNVKRNAEILKSLQSDRSSSPKIFSSRVDNKELAARRSAPTQLYSSKNIEKYKPENSYISKKSKSKNPYNAFLEDQPTNVATASADKLHDLRNSILQGELLHAVLETAINSDIPGMVRAVVSEPVYAYKGNSILIPKGSRLVGDYTSVAGNGAATDRVYVVWNRVITPDGLSIIINSPNSDQLGRSGLGADNVDTHFFKIFGSSALLSIIGAGAATFGVSSHDQPNSADAYQQAVAQSFQMTAGNTLRRNLGIRPTLNINQGAKVNVFVARDIRFPGGV